MARKVVVKKERHSICFVAPTAFPLLANDPSLGYVGGAELQQTLIAREMVKRGHKVSMICMNHGQENNINVNGVTVYRAYKPDEGIPVLRFIYPRFTSIWRSMKEANADIYYQRSAGMLTGIVSAFCCKYGRESIYAAASNKDFVRNTPRIKYKRDRMLFEYGLKNVSRIVVQNTDQKSLLKRNYGRDSNIVGNGYALPVRKNVQNEGYILWVSTIKSVKQPQIYLELAKSLPQYSFKMIGGQGLGQERLYKRIEATATMIHNLEFLGFVPHVEVDAYFNDALLFINTSESEGFPNTFLQA